MGSHFDLVRDSAGLLNELVQEELELCIRNSSNIAEETTPGKDELFYLVGPGHVYSMYRKSIWEYSEAFDDSIPRSDPKGRERFYTVLMMVKLFESDDSVGQVWKTLLDEAESDQEEALVEVALDLKNNLRSKGMRLSDYYSDYPAANQVARRISIFFFPVNIVRGYRKDIADVFFDQDIHPDEFEDVFTETLSEFVVELNVHMTGKRLDDVNSDGVLPRELMFCWNHEVTHWYIDRNTEDHELGSVEEGFAQFTDDFLDLKKKTRIEDGYSISSNADLYEPYEEKGYSKELVNWTVQILQEKYKEYNDGGSINGALDEFREDAVEFFETDPDGAEDLFRFMMPDKIKEEVREVEKVIQHDIDRPLMKFLKQYKNNQAPPGFLERADLEDEQEVKSAVYTAQKFEEIVLKKLVVNAVENKEDYGFYEKELDKLIEDEARKIIRIVKRIKTLWRVLKENGHKSDELENIVDSLRDAEDELEELDTLLK